MDIVFFITGTVLCSEDAWWWMSLSKGNSACHTHFDCHYPANSKAYPKPTSYFKSKHHRSSGFTSSPVVFPFTPGNRRVVRWEAARRAQEAPQVHPARGQASVEDWVWHHALRRRRHVQRQELPGEEQRRTAGHALRLHAQVDAGVCSRHHEVPGVCIKCNSISCFDTDLCFPLKTWVDHELWCSKYLCRPALVPKDRSILFVEILRTGKTDWTLSLFLVHFAVLRLCRTFFQPRWQWRETWLSTRTSLLLERKERWGKRKLVASLADVHNVSMSKKNWLKRLDNLE